MHKYFSSGDPGKFIYPDPALLGSSRTGNCFVIVKVSYPGAFTLTQLYEKQTIDLFDPARIPILQEK
jgi:hypothetical protein